MILKVVVIQLVHIVEVIDILNFRKNILLYIIYKMSMNASLYKALVSGGLTYVGFSYALVAGEPTDVRYCAVAYGNKLDQRRTLSQRSAVVPTPVNIMFLNIIIIHYLYHKYLYLYHIIYILYSKSRLMTLASYGQAVTSASYHHLATSVLLLSCRTLRSWTTGAWEP